MNKILLLPFFSFYLSAYELSENYLFEKNTIYSTDLISDVPKKFEILQIPKERVNYRIESQVIAKSFELNGITVDSTKIRFINFTKKSPIDFSQISLQIETALTNHYPTLQINHISIMPRGYLATLPNNAKVFLDERFYLRRSGTLYVVDKNGLRRYLDYTVDATLPILHTAQNVSRKEYITNSNTIKKIISFQNFREKPLMNIPEHPFRYRSNLKAGQLLTERNIEETPMVLKNEKVVVEVRNDTVVLEFIAIATQEGSLYDIITVQKRDGKRAKAKIIGENRVELQ